MCLKCSQNLSHAAYICHQNPIVCPGKSETRKSVCMQTSDADHASSPSAQPCFAGQSSSKPPRFLMMPSSRRAILLWASNVKRSADLLTLRDMMCTFWRKYAARKRIKYFWPKTHYNYNLLEDCIIRKRGGLHLCTIQIIPIYHVEKNAIHC